jgi:hypothetical protein
VRVSSVVGQPQNIHILFDNPHSTNRLQRDHTSESVFDALVELVTASSPFTAEAPRFGCPPRVGPSVAVLEEVWVELRLGGGSDAVS